MRVLRLCTMQADSMVCTITSPHAISGIVHTRDGIGEIRPVVPVLPGHARFLHPYPLGRHRRR